MPFDMPKLRRRLRQNEFANGAPAIEQTQGGNIMIPIPPGQSTADSSEISQASSSHSVREDAKTNLSEYSGLKRNTNGEDFSCSPPSSYPLESLATRRGAATCQI